MAESQPIDVLFTLRKRGIFAKHFSPGKEDLNGLFQDRRSYLELQTLLMDAGFKNCESDIDGRNAHTRVRPDASLDLLIETDIRNVNQHGFTFLTLPNDDALEKFFTDYQEWDLSRSRYGGLEHLKKEDARLIAKEVSGSPWRLAMGLGGAYLTGGAILLVENIYNSLDEVLQNPLVAVPSILVGLGVVSGLGYFYSSTTKRTRLREGGERTTALYSRIEKDFLSRSLSLKKEYLDHMIYGKPALEQALTLPKRTS